MTNDFPSNAYSWQIGIAHPLPAFWENQQVFQTLMDIEYYEKTLRQMEEAKFLYQGLEDIREQRLRDGESLIADMRERYDL